MNSVEDELKASLIGKIVGLTTILTVEDIKDMIEDLITNDEGLLYHLYIVFNGENSLSIYRLLIETKINIINRYKEPLKNELL